jgi:hypothetical protein
MGQSQTHSHGSGRVLLGTGCLGRSLLPSLCLVFSDFQFSYGRQPRLMAGVTFSIVVVIGNLLMYQVCSITAIKAIFIYVGDREVCHMLCYRFVGTFNVVLDLCCNYKLLIRSTWACARKPRMVICWKTYRPSLAGLSLMRYSACRQILGGHMRLLLPS